MRILVLDPYRDAADSLAELLNAGGHQAASAHSAAHAVTVSGSFQPDLVLMELVLPGVHYGDLCRRFRSLPNGPTVIAFTGYVMSRDAVLAAGFDDYLLKPVDYQVLSACLLRFASKAPSAGLATD